MLQVLIPFTGHGYNMPNPGTLIDPPDAVAAHLVEIGVAAYYETKVDSLPKEIKKKKPSASLRPARVARKKTPKRSKKSAKK